MNDPVLEMSLSESFMLTTPMMFEAHKAHTEVLLLNILRLENTQGRIR